MRTPPIAVLALFAASTLGCPSAKDKASAEAEKSAPTAGAEAEASDVHMREHFAKADQIKAALIAGRLDDARAPATWIAEHEHEIEHPPTAEPQIQSMRDAAKLLASAKDLDTATQQFVTLGQACAGCHEVAGGVEYQPTLMPESAAADGTRAHMARHQWAVDQLWVGLTTPSRAAWIAGAEVLAEAPLAPEQLAPNQTLSPEVKAMADRVHELGRLALDVPVSAGIPGVIYGELLTTCERCHAATRVN